MTRTTSCLVLALCAAALVSANALGQTIDESEASGGQAALANGPVELFLHESDKDAAKNAIAPPSAVKPQPREQRPTHRPQPPIQESQKLGGANSTEKKAESRDSKLPVAAVASDFSFMDIARVIGALAGVLGLAWTIRSILRRANGLGSNAPRPSGVVEILASYPVPGARGRGQDILLIKVARRIIVAHAAKGSSGPTMTPLCELTHPDEVAGLLSRLEAGAAPRHVGRFRDALKSFQAEPAAEVRGQRAEVRKARAGAGLREADRLIGSGDRAPEIVDLTRSGSRGLLAWLGGSHRA